MSHTSPTSTSARSPAPSESSRLLGVDRELVAREHVELGLGLGGEQLRDHPARGERGEAGDERDRRRRAARGARDSRARARAARIGPYLASIVGDHAIDLARERREIAGVLDHPGRGRELVGERRLRGDPRARVVGGEPVARDQRALPAPRAARPRRSGRRAGRTRGSRRAARPRRTRRSRRRRPTRRSPAGSRRRCAGA